jgi:hypothetical protein
VKFDAQDKIVKANIKYQLLAQEKEIEAHGKILEAHGKILEAHGREIEALKKKVNERDQLTG